MYQRFYSIVDLKCIFTSDVCKKTVSSFLFQEAKIHKVLKKNTNLNSVSQPVWRGTLLCRQIFPGVPPYFLEFFKSLGFFRNESKIFKIKFATRKFNISKCPAFQNRLRNPDLNGKHFEIKARIFVYFL